jgi:Phytochelatin synthase
MKVLRAWRAFNGYFPVLANQFEAQSNPAFCGPTSAAIVLNAVYGRNPDLRRDWSRLHEGDLKYAPPNIDPSIPRFTQDNVITKGQKDSCAGPWRAINAQRKAGH